MHIHRTYQHMLPLRVYGELTDAADRALANHLAECAACERELDAIETLHRFLAATPLPQPSDSMLAEARTRSQSRLASEHLRPSLWGKVRDAFSLPAVYRPAFAAGGLALLLVGFIVVRLVESSAQRSVPVAAVAPSSEVRVTNVRILGGGTSGEDVELAFDAVRQVRVRGSLEDPEIQRVLALALVNGENAGIRLRAVGSINAVPATVPEPEIKAALLLALRTDNNDGVRKEALNTLLRFPADREVRDALLHVLLRDANPGLRIAAINGLDTLLARGYQPDEQLLQTFRQELQHDGNMYVRVKARSILEERTQ